MTMFFNGRYGPSPPRSWITQGSPFPFLFPSPFQTHRAWFFFVPGLRTIPLSPPLDLRALSLFARFVPVPSLLPRYFLHPPPLELGTRAADFPPFPMPESKRTPSFSPLFLYDTLPYVKEGEWSTPPFTVSRAVLVQQNASFFFSLLKRHLIPISPSDRPKMTPPPPVRARRWASPLFSFVFDQEGWGKFFPSLPF